MGHKDSFTGGGGNIGNDLRDGIDDWLGSRVVGRGAAAAYAYRTGNAETLRELGLDYVAMRSNPNVIDVVHQIAQKICEDLPPGTIDTEEQIRIVADIAEWIVTTDVDGNPPSPAEIAVETLAVVLNWAYLTTTAAELNTKDLPGSERIAFEAGVRAACEELAAQADLSPTGATPSEFTAAIEHGLEFLQAIYEASDE